jgi:septal ring factor EnvC (AmiA/AmiB activator)
MRSSAWVRVGGAFLLSLLIAVAFGTAQETSEDVLRRQIRESQDRLERIRGERRRLQNELQGLTSEVHNVSEEIRNIERQITASSSLVAELDVQLLALLEQVAISTRDMLLTRDQLTAREVVLRERLREIYKRGPLAPVQVLLAATSFADLLNRYKYLHQVALFDRLLVQEVGRLEHELEDHRAGLARDAESIRDVRDEKSLELEELNRLEQQRQRRLTNYASRQTQAESRLAQLAAEEEQLRGVLASLEEQRRALEAASGAVSVSTMTTGDLGQLGWPVEGSIVYNFGPERQGNTTILREGIGIAAPVGTPVRTVEAGEVRYAEFRGISGYTVIIGHGGGYYSVYLHLQGLSVSTGDRVAVGQVIGRVGDTAAPDLPPYIEFQIHEPSGSGDPRAVDPVRWLRGRS